MPGTLLGRGNPGEQPERMLVVLVTLLTKCTTFQAESPDDSAEPRRCEASEHALAPTSRVPLVSRVGAACVGEAAIKHVFRTSPSYLRTQAAKHSRTQAAKHSSHQRCACRPPARQGVQAAWDHGERS